MSSRAAFDDKERIRQAVDIVDLVGGYLQLRREGRGYKALCPWHDDTRPSLQINPERQSFKCWVCDVGGDIFSFIMKMENIDFREAVEMLADRAGITLTPFRPQSAGGAGEAASGGAGNSGGGNADDKRTLYQAAAWAEQLFHECLLKSPEAEPARKYLQGRGIHDDSIRRFHLGYAPDRWDWLIKQALRTNTFSPKVLERVGLLVRKQDGPGHYDRFKGRVLFSIRDAQGRPVAVGGRILPELAATNPAKYVNSSESPLFSKSNMLYGLDLARDAVTESGAAVVMEGYTDCIMAQQHGCEHAVAVLGTALGEGHIRLLRRFAERIILVLDGDEAGQKRTGEILSLFVAAQVDLRVVTLPEGLDPCDFLSQRGVDRFREFLDNSVDALEHAFRLATRGLDIVGDPHAAQRALDALLQTIARAPRLRESTTSQNRIREWSMLTRLARMFNVDEVALRGRVSELRQKQRSARAATGKSEAASEGSGGVGEGRSKAPAATEPLGSWDRELLEVLLLEPESVAAVAEVIRPEQLGSDAARRIFAACRRLSAAGQTPDFSRLLLEFDDPRDKNLLVELDEHGRSKVGGDAATRLRELLDGFRRREAQRQSRIQSRVLEERRLGADEELAVLQQLIDRERNRQGISESTDG